MRSVVLFVSEDLLFWPTVAAAAARAGRQVVRVPGEEEMARAFREGGVARIVADLDVRSLDLLAWARRWKRIEEPPELIGFGSHVDDDALERALDGGFDRVLPRSRFHRELAAWL